MRDDPNARRGAFIPFRTPFEVTGAPDVQPDDTPQVCIPFNDLYTPYVQGALKALARPETFAGDESDLQAWVSAMYQLLLTEPVDYPHVPNWEPYEVGSPIELEYMAQRGQGLNGPFYAISTWTQYSHWKFRDRLTHNDVGGLCNVFRIVDTSGLNPFTVDVYRCDGYHYHFVQGGYILDVISAMGGQQEIKEIEVFAEYWAGLQMILKNDWTCEG